MDTWIVTIPVFSSPAQADAWMEKQAKLDRSAREHQRMAKEAVDLSGPAYLADNNDRVLYSTERSSTGKFVCAVFKSSPPGHRWDRCVYAREFAKRKDAKAMAYKLYFARQVKKP